MNVRTLSLVEAANELGLPGGWSGTAGRQRVYRMVVRGELRAVRIGRGLRIPVSELARLINEQ